MQKIYKSLSPHSKSLISLFLLSFIQAQARKEELRKQPEQVILSEVRQVVQQMQALNQHLDEAVSLSHKNLIHCLHGKCTQNFTRKLLVSE